MRKTVFVVEWKGGVSARRLSTLALAQTYAESFANAEPYKVLRRTTTERVVFTSSRKTKGEK